MIDCIVVGGGPAGLLAAMYLARFRRTVTLVDGGAGRAHRIPRSHNYPGIAEGLGGAELIAALRRQVTMYDVTQRVGKVESISQVAGGFRVTWAQSSAEARTVVLGTGVSDVEPDMPHLAEALRDGAIRYCPVCDAYEVTGQRVGVLVAGVAGIHEAICLRRYTDRVTMFRTGPDPLPADEQERAEQAGVTLAAGTLNSVRAWDARVTVEHGDQSTECDTLYCALGLRVHSDLASSLGAAADKDGYLLVDRHQETTVPGLFAAGDVASGLNQISVAYGGATIAAAAINVALSAAR